MLAAAGGDDDDDDDGGCCWYKFKPSRLYSCSRVVIVVITLLLVPFDTCMEKEIVGKNTKRTFVGCCFLLRFR